MNFRFRVYELDDLTPVNGELGTPVDVEGDYEFTFYLNDVVIFNGAVNLQGGSSRTYVSVPLLLGVPMRITFYDSGRVKLFIPTNDLNYANHLRIVVKDTSETYHNYDNLFEIYGYDIGNDENEQDDVGNNIVFNQDVKLHLVNKSFNSSQAFGSFAAYRKPYSDEIQVVNTSSFSTGKVVYIDTNYNHLLSGRNGFITHKDLATIIQRTEIMPEEIVYMTDPALVMNHSLIPEMNLSVASASNPEQETTYLQGNRATVFFDFTGITVFRIDDSKQLPYDQLTISFVVKSLTSGSILGLDVQTVDLSTYFTTTFNPYDYTYNLPNLKSSEFYNVTATVSEGDNFTDVISEDVIPYSYYEILDQGDNIYKFANDSNEACTIILKEYGKQGELINLEIFPLAAYEETTYQFKTDGVYFAEFDRAGVDNYTRYIFALAEYKKCFIEILNFVIHNCNDFCDTDAIYREQFKLYQLASLNISITSLILMVNNYTTKSPTVDVISNNDLDDLFTVERLIQTTKNLCDGCNK
jgi:hypothetical protein